MTDLLYSTMPKDVRGTGDKYSKLLNSIYGYINDRRDFMFNNAKKGNIKANEDEFVCRKGIWDTNYNIIKNPQEKTSYNSLDFNEFNLGAGRQIGHNNFNPFRHQPVIVQGNRLFINENHQYRDGIEDFIRQAEEDDLLAPPMQEEPAYDEDEDRGYFDEDEEF
jgi:hypothetical protein